MRTLKLTPFLLGIILLFTYCSKEEMEFTRPGTDNHEVGQKDQPEGDDCLVVQTLWAGAGQNNTANASNAGYVTAEIAYPYLYVTYYTTGMWLLTEAHLWVGTDLNDVPKKAAPGRFPYKANLNYVTEYMFPVDLAELGIGPDDLVYVAAHGVVEGQGYVDLEELLPATANVFVKYYNHAPGFTDSYFHVDLSDAGFLNGLNYNGWCLDLGTPMNFDAPYNPYLADVYNSYGMLPVDLVNNPGNLPGINFLLNQDLSGYSVQDIQVAIWVLLEGFGEQYFIDNQGTLGVTGFNWTNVQELVALALANLDFVPECGGYIGIILVNDDQQTVIIKVPVPCEGEGDETVWAFGEHTFIENNIANKWGWVFEVDLSECD